MILCLEVLGVALVAMVVTVVVTGAVEAVVVPAVSAETTVVYRRLPAEKSERKPFIMRKREWEAYLAKYP